MAPTARRSASRLKPAVMSLLLAVCLLQPKASLALKAPAPDDSATDEPRPLAPPVRRLLQAEGACAAYGANLTLTPVDSWCLQNTWASVGCSTTAATPNAILPHYWTDPWWQAATYSSIQADMLGWATSADPARRTGCYGPTTDPCAAYRDNPSKTPVNPWCLQNTWADVGCATDATTPNAILPHYWTDSWWRVATYASIKADMLGWATSSDPTRRTGCYGSITDPCATYQVNPSKTPVNLWCLQSTWAAVGCTTDVSTPDAILPHYWTDAWWRAATYSSIKADMQSWVLTPDNTRFVGCHGPMPSILPPVYLPPGPLWVAYYDSQSSNTKFMSGADMDLAKIPPFINVVVVGPVRHDCTYTKGSLSLPLDATGLAFASSGPVVRDAIATLKASNANRRVLLGVLAYFTPVSSPVNAQCIADIVADLGLDGVNLEWRPMIGTSAGACTSSGGKVSCRTDAQAVDTVTKLRAALPNGRALLTAASTSVGCYGEGAFAASKPASDSTGISLALARSPAGASLDLVTILTYDFGGFVATGAGFDVQESLRAHRAAWPNTPLALGVTSVSGWNPPTLAQVDDYVGYLKAQGGVGMYVYFLQAPGTPSAQDILARACTDFDPLPGLPVNFCPM